MNIVFISSLQPFGHYSQILLSGLVQQDINVIVYADQDVRNTSLKNLGKIKNVWNRGLGFVPQIIKELIKDKPHAVHIQHEFNMYGSPITALAFPFLVAIIRVLGYPVVVTIHGVVSAKQVNADFMNLFFFKQSPLMNPTTLTIFFSIIYRLIGVFSTKIVCHTHILSNILNTEYGIDEHKIVTIETAIPEKNIPPLKKELYFFYYGYMVRRKGLEALITGFARFSKKHPKYKLILAGGTIEGQEKAADEIHELIKKNTCSSSVEIKGYITTEEHLAKLYTQATAVVIPARISIAASGPLYQAQGYHKCILASKIGNFCEEIENNVTGILVENSEWEVALERIIQEPNDVHLIEQAVTRRAEEKNPYHTGKKYAALYADII